MTKREKYLLALTELSKTDSIVPDPTCRICAGPLDWEPAAHGDGLAGSSVNYGHGVVFGIGLQAIEAAVGLGLGFIFLAREGFTFAMLKRMPEVTDLDVDEDERVERIA